MMSPEAYLREKDQINAKFYAARDKAQEDRYTATIQLVEKAVKTDAEPAPLVLTYLPGEVQP